MFKAFERVAILELAKLAQQIGERHCLQRLVIGHRFGIVPVGEASLLVGCSAPHRVNPLQSLGEVVGLIKRDVPMGKRKYFADGEFA